MAIWNDIWNESGQGARVAVTIGAVAVLAVALWLAFRLVPDRYQVLFADMEARDASSVVAELERMKVDYRLEENGTRVLVPGESVHETRLKLMGSGVPLSGGVGFEIFDNAEFGMTDFAQRINFQRALEGELTRTIVSLDEVKFARVHLVMPEQGLFRSNESPPSASITLFLKDGMTLGPERVLGIQRLVASAVPKLDPSGVTITDELGLTLSRDLSGSENTQVVSGRLAVKKEVESYLSDKITNLLNGAFAADQVMVSVDVTLDFDQVKTTLEDVMPPQSGTDGGVIRRRETASGSDTLGREGRNVTTEVEYRLGHRIEQIVTSPGRILRMNVGVLVPGRGGDLLEDRIRELVATVAGFDAARGDAITIFSTGVLGTDAAPGAVAQSGSDESISLPSGADPGAQEEASPSPAMSLVIEEPEAALNRAFDSAPSPSDAQPGFSMQAVALGVALLVVGVLLVVAISRTRQSERPATLSAAERERVLEELKQWLKLESAESVAGDNGP